MDLRTSRRYTFSRILPCWFWGLQGHSSSFERRNGNINSNYSGLPIVRDFLTAVGGQNGNFEPKLKTNTFCIFMAIRPLLWICFKKMFLLTIISLRLQHRTAGSEERPAVTAGCTIGGTLILPQLIRFRVLLFVRHWTILLLAQLRLWLVNCFPQPFRRMVVFCFNIQFCSPPNPSLSFPTSFVLPVNAFLPLTS